MHPEIADVLRAAGGLVCRREHPHLAVRLDHLARRGELRVVLPGVFALPGLPEPEVSLRAGLLWAGPDAVLCHRAAARSGFWPGCPVPVIELARPGRAKRPRAGWRVHDRRIPPDLVCEAGGLRFTHPALTAVDLAAGPLGGEAIDRVLRTRSAGLDQLWEALARTPGRRGNRRRAQLLHDSRDLPWSEAERLLHRLMRADGLTGWRTNVPVAGTPYLADVCFDRERVVVEVDGWETHGGREAFEADRVRRNRLELAGYLVLNVTWRQLTEQPGLVLGWIRAALGRI
ncbi:very-short-patch-repair endonuclease [Friedmanniella endophytica]|uniref:Very-short-patch-repair endonuclease n=1 Tax=Microlunatus kandeliicorticis TaxID=1759536 RepID=A0A7W3IVG6_9ACTN|nr:DUF559 domain-containing protein [Microlunatus kandeliicorticis]MBA8795994.1 very-short-patch-repair endonuclease [Microlunatus kandeliicorticis]